MTEADWLAGKNRSAMIGWLSDRSPSVRKMRLWLCSCCHPVWRSAADVRSRLSVEVAERYADGQATAPELADAHRAATRASDEGLERWQRGMEESGGDWGGYEHEGCDGATSAADLCAGVSLPEFDHATPWNLASAAISAAEYAVDPRPYEAVIRDRGPARSAAVSRAVAAQVASLHDVFGNPFRPVAFAPAWRTDTVVALARGIYDERAYDRFPLLMDALMDAGCDNDDILNHCRCGGPHVRGCWVVDLILDKG